MMKVGGGRRAGFAASEVFENVLFPNHDLILENFRRKAVQFEELPGFFAEAGTFG
jgi:hypothetical protein